MRKKKNALFMAVVFAAVLGGITGCSDTKPTEEQLVIPKTELGQQILTEDSANAGQAEDGNSASTDSAQPSGSQENIAQQVQAPERFQTDFSNKGITVHVDAPVIVPEAAGFQLYTVKGRPFSQEDYDKVRHVVLQDAPLWERDYEAMSDSKGFTKEEIEMRITQLEKTPNAKEEEETWEKMQDSAPEKLITVEVPSIVPYFKASEEELEEMENGLTYNIDIFIKNQLCGNATVEGEDYWVYLINNFQEDNHNIQFFIQNLKQNYENNYIILPEEEKPVSIAPDKLREYAVELVEEMGFTDFVPSGEEYYIAATTGTGGFNGGDIGYGFHFTRSLEGIPVTYTHETGSTVESDNDSYVIWSYETLDLVFDGENLTDFLWRNPYNIEKKTEEYVFLMPFSDIQNIFKEMMLEKHKWTTGNEDILLQFDIKEVRLGYMRIRDKNGGNEGTMIPVWDFLGNQTIQYTEEETINAQYSGKENHITENISVDVNTQLLQQAYTREQSILQIDSEYGCADNDAYCSLLTINAMDGTVIDRALGY